MPSDINGTIAEVLRLDAEATQGPWHYEPHWGDVYDFTGKPPYRSRRGVTDDCEDGAAIVGARGQDVIYEGTFTAHEQTAGHIGLTEEDHTLIAYYRTAAPALAREVQRLQAELLTTHRTWAERCSAWSDSVEEAEAQRDAAYRAGQEAMRERCAALCDDWEAINYCDEWMAMELGAQQCAEAIRALEVQP